ncbi:hypothetical protein MANES_15G178980v8 [Manihot esculenta]|uniref:Uncharacterized protein n=1 Tax=Manihot esculenta TaxID=3983 RepID=A0ACB7GCD0_MANES|nr:hypothetical protein MANES_15G178980v8 [Manihot esculenta]
MVTGPLAVPLLGSPVDHRILPLLTFIATHPLALVFAFDGFKMKIFLSEFAMLVYTLFVSCCPQYPPPPAPPGPASCTESCCLASLLEMPIYIYIPLVSLTTNG